jgi:hypothetical protein
MSPRSLITCVEDQRPPAARDLALVEDGGGPVRRQRREFGRDRPHLLGAYPPPELCYIVYLAVLHFGFRTAGKKAMDRKCGTNSVPTKG